MEKAGQQVGGMRGIREFNGDMPLFDDIPLP
jgi:hypothetical protein